MNLDNLIKPKGANRNKKRLGRGIGSGHGKTACRGHKGQKARAGYKALPAWEGGQMPLYRVLGKSGFTNIFKKHYEILNLDDIEKLGLAKIDISVLQELGLVSSTSIRLKVLGRGALSKPVEVTAHKVSKTAKEAIEKLNGKINIVEEKKFLRIKKKKAEAKK